MRSSLLPLLAASFFATNAVAQSLPLIDDFATGDTYRVAPSGTSTVSTNGGGIFGGSRRITTYNANNPYAQALSVSVHRGVDNAAAPAGLVYSAGYGLMGRVEVGWGYGAPVSADLTPYSAIRVTFTGITTVLNFNFEVFSNTKYVQWGCNLSPTSPGHDYTVDLPIQPSSTVNLHQIDHFYLIAQDSYDFAIKRVELVGRGAHPASQTCSL